MERRMGPGGEHARSIDLRVATGDAGVVLYVSGELDATTSPRLREELVSLIDGGVAALDLDLSELGFVDSVGLSVLVSAHHRARSEGVPYRLVNVAAGCRRILEITRLDAILTVGVTNSE
jgi:anti-sigma B factor antagonist